MGNPWEESMKWYIKAFECIPRVEPLLKISIHYRDKNWLLCFTFADLACKLDYPEKCILFIDQVAYDYMRWHILSLSGWYSGFHEQGKIGCLKALQARPNSELDKNNLMFYQEKKV
jgi:hypothetical protein